MMIPLLLSAFIALTVIFERFYFLKKVFHLPPTDAQALHTSLKSGDLASIQKNLILTTPVTSVLKEGVKHFSASPAELERIMSNEAQRWIPLLEKRLEILDTVITAAPLMGLLGTITGMMASFQVLSENGVNEPNAITGGVAEALIATATGLVIALVCLLAYNYFNALVKHYLQSIEDSANLLLESRLKKS